MKQHRTVVAAVMLFVGLSCGYLIPGNQAYAQGKAVPAEQKITVLSPLGTPAAVKLKPMAPRLASLEGKTIYLINQGYLGTDNLLHEMEAWFAKEMPKTKIVYKEMGMTMGPQTPPIYAEIKQNADAVIMGLGH